MKMLKNKVTTSINLDKVQFQWNYKQMKTQNQKI